MQGDTSDEAVAFLAACAQTTDAPWGAALLARAVVVQTADAWRMLEGHSSTQVSRDIPPLKYWYATSQTAMSPLKLP